MNSAHISSARLHAVPLDLDVTLAEAVRRLAHRERVTAWSGAWSRGGLVTCDPVRAAEPGMDPLRVPAVQPVVAQGSGVGGGWFGYLSYSGRSSWAWYRDLLRHDGERWWFEALLDHDYDARSAALRCAELVADLRVQASVPPATLELLGISDRGAHIVAVERCVQAIRRGEVYQANIATALDLRLTGSPADAWAQLVEALAPARAGFVADPAGTAISASPELFLQRTGRVVRTEPIKGTRPRTGGPADAAERLRLAASAKDAAENVMIVDLMRNDLSRVCATGTVTVPGLLALEPHPGVWHLVSHVRGELAAGRDDGDLLEATFPPGSVTGAPKVRAVELIEELEARPRGLFTGALGYVSPVAGLELAVAIRTLEVAPDGTARLGVGGGITVDSTPAQEWTECLVKAAPLLRVLAGAVPWDAAEEPGPADPAQGIFETLLVVDGKPCRLADHLRRLHRSFWELYGVPLTADVPAAIAAVAGSGTQRVRVDAAPGRPDRVEVVAQPVTPQPRGGVVLRPVTVPAGVAHKFADRRWLNRLESPESIEHGVLPLLVDPTGIVLESIRSNIAAVRGGRLATPPLDGRILPGTARQALLDTLDEAGAGYDIEPLRLEDLAAADGVLLANAVRGVQWVREIEGVGKWEAPDPLTAWLAATWNLVAVWPPV